MLQQRRAQVTGMMTDHAQMSWRRGRRVAQQPVSGTERQCGSCKRGDLARARLGVEDHELARQRDQADEDYGLDLDDAVPRAPRARWNA